LETDFERAVVRDGVSFLLVNTASTHEFMVVKMKNLFRFASVSLIFLGAPIFADSGAISRDSVLTPADAASYRQFGSELDMQGSRLIVTSKGDGSFYEYDIDSSGNVSNETKISTGYGSGDFSYSHGVAISGIYSMIGGSNHDGGASSSGETQTYTSGALVTETTHTGYAQNFGTDLDITNNGGTVYRIVGSGNDYYGEGSIYFYKDEMTDEQKISPSWVVSDTKFGEQVAIEGTIAVASGWRHNSFTGIAAVYKYDGSQWSEVAVLSPADIAPYDRFGGSIAISGNTIFIGSYGDDDQSNGAGAVYVFHTSDDGATWTQVDKLYSYDGGASFGKSVAIDDNTAIIGSSAGVYVYETSDGGLSWSPVARLEDSSSEGSSKLAINNGVVVVASPNYDSTGLNNNGAVFIYDLSSHATDDDGDGLWNSADNCPSVSNLDQSDIDGDGAGDLCDDDIDGDGHDNGVDAFPNDASEYSDADGDAVGDNSDNCITVANLDQADSDGDLLGDACELDSDGDGVDDNDDNCPLVSNVSQADADGDSIGDACENDTDGDGIPDSSENLFGTNPNDPSDVAQHQAAVLSFITALKENSQMSASIDTDNDGLSDALEVALGGDPMDDQDSGIATQLTSYIVDSIGKNVPAMGGLGLFFLGISMLALGSFRVKMKRARKNL